MKKIYILITVFALLVLTACGQSTSDDQSGETSDKKVIKIGATPDAYPQYYKEDDEMKGFVVDLVEVIFEKVDYEVEWVVADWVGIQGQMETGKIDTIGNFAMSPERQEKYNFTEPYYYSGAAIAVSKDNNDIHSLEDLKGKKVAGEMGASYTQIVEEYNTQNDGDIEIIQYEGPEVIHQDVARGKVDAFVSGREILLGKINDKGIPLKVVGETFGEKLVGFPFDKTEKNDKLIADVNQAITELREDGTLKTISEKWFNEDVTVSNAQ